MTHQEVPPFTSSDGGSNCAIVRVQNVVRHLLFELWFPSFQSEELWPLIPCSRCSSHPTWNLEGELGKRFDAGSLGTAFVRAVSGWFGDSACERCFQRVGILASVKTKYEPLASISRKKIVTDFRWRGD